MAHKQGHTGPLEKIQTAPNFIDQLTQAFTQAPERFKKLQKQPGLLPTSPKLRGSDDPANVLNAALNVDEAFVGNTFSDVIGALLSVPSMINPFPKKSPGLERAGRAVGNFVGAEDIVPLGGAAGGVIRTFVSPAQFRTGNKALRSDEFAKLTAGLKTGGSETTDDLIDLVETSTVEFNMSIRPPEPFERSMGATVTPHKLEFVDTGVGKRGQTALDLEHKPQGSIDIEFPQLTLEEKVQLNSDIAPEHLKDVSRRQFLLQDTSVDVARHELTHAFTYPIVRKYQFGGNIGPADKSIAGKRLEAAFDKLPFSQQDLALSAGVRGSFRWTTETFARIADVGHLIGLKVTRGEAISKSDNLIYEMNREIIRESASARGLPMPKRTRLPARVMAEEMTRGGFRNIKISEYTPRELRALAVEALDDLKKPTNKPPLSLKQRRTIATILDQPQPVKGPTRKQQVLDKILGSDVNRERTRFKSDTNQALNAFFKER